MADNISALGKQREFANAKNQQNTSRIKQKNPHKSKSLVSDDAGHAFAT